MRSYMYMYWKQTYAVVLYCRIQTFNLPDLFFQVCIHIYNRITTVIYNSRNRNLGYKVKKTSYQKHDSYSDMIRLHDCVSFLLAIRRPYLANSLGGKRIGFVWRSLHLADCTFRSLRRFPAVVIAANRRPFRFTCFTLF